MDRRRFLSLLGAGVAGIALEQAIPFGRVWSFPSQIVLSCSERLDLIALKHWVGVDFGRGPAETWVLQNGVWERSLRDFEYHQRFANDPGWLNLARH